MAAGVKVWVDGRVADAGTATVDALDHGMTVGDGVFETLKVVDGVPFATARHLARLARSARGLGLQPPEEGLVRTAITELLDSCRGDAPSLSLARLRLTWTAGPGPLGSERSPDRHTLVAAVAASPPWPPAARAATVAWTRNERSAIAGLKTTSYAENVVALHEARRRGADEALLANTRGELCEGTGSNIVVAVDGELLTPPLQSGCLAGITRELLLEWGAEEGLPVLEQPLGFDVLQRCDEALLTSSTRDVQPLRAVDDRELALGPLGRRAAELFTRRARDEIDP